MTDDLDAIEWGPKTPYVLGETVLDRSLPQKLWWDTEAISIYPAGRGCRIAKSATHYAYPKPPPMTEAVGHWASIYPLDIFRTKSDMTHRVTITFPGDDMPEFQVEIPGEGYVKVEKVG